MASESMAPPPSFKHLLDLSAEGATKVQSALRAAEDFLVAAGVGAGARDRVALVLEEALMNLVMHGARVGGVRSASLQVSVQPSGIELQVVDDGQAFDPRSQALPALPGSLATATPGGQGLRLMRHFTREMHYASGAQGNCLTLLLDRS